MAKSDVLTPQQRLFDVIGQPLIYSGRNRIQIVPLNLNDLVTEMAHLLEAAVGNRAALKLSLGAKLAPIEGDSTQIRQIAINLVTNAAEAVGDEGRIVAVSTGVQICDESFLADAYLAEDCSEGEHVYLEVADAGGGIVPEHLDASFDSFYPTKASGRGLGLAAVLEIVRGHRGAIKVKSKLGYGTTIQVLFPAANKQAAPKETPRPTTHWRGSGVVLLVDDDLDVLAVAKRALERLGFDVLTATDGLKGLDIYRQRAEQIKLVLLDLTMPNLDGEKTYRRMRQIRDDVRVVLSSGYAHKEIDARFAGQGIAGFLQKPFSFRVLSEVVREALEA